MENEPAPLFLDNSLRGREERSQSAGSSALDQRSVRVPLDPLEDELRSIVRNVEVADVEAGWKLGQRTLRACLQIEHAEVLVANSTGENRQCLRVRQKTDAASAAGQHDAGK